MKLNTKQELLLTTLLAISVVLVGCGGGTTKTDGTVTNNTNSNTTISQIYPTGTIQGVLIDSVTQQPIVGAIIDAGVGAVSTNQNGQFVLANLPATNVGTSAAGGTTLAGTYQVSINLKKVTSPIKMTDPAVVKRYPDFAYKTAAVFYTSDVAHPLTGVANGYQFKVGKQAATIKGVVTDVDGASVPAGYNVTLYSAIDAQNSATGGTGQGPVVTAAPLASSTGHIIGTTTTDATGNFTFANIEAGVGVVIAAQDTATTVYGEKAVTAPTENATRTLSFQSGDAVIVKSTDTLPPTILSVTPVNNADIAPAATSVVFTFSEPIKQTTPVANVSPSNPNGLYSKVNVNFTGPKPLASNLSHSLAWNAAGTQLTVTIPALGASSMYTVDISPAVTAGMLADNAGNVMAVPVAPATTTTAMQTVNFTTNGGATAAAPVIAMTNSASVNATSILGAPVAATLNWLPTSGAKGYNVYRTMKEVWPTSTIVHPTVKLNATALFATTYTDPFTDSTLAPATLALDYVEFGAVKQTYDYVVKAINSDGSESAASAPVTAVDVVAPALIGVPQKAVVCGAAVTCDPITGKIKDITITFDEQMNKDTATNPANYTSAQLGTFSAATYTPATLAVAAPQMTWVISAPAKVKLTLATPVTPLPVDAAPFSFITTGANGINNTFLGFGDAAVIGAGNGAPNSVCVRAGTVGANPVAAPVGDDLLVAFTVTTAGYFHSGPNGVCETTAGVAIAPAVSDVQVLPVGNGTPGSVAVNPSATGILITPFVPNSACVTAAAVGATAMTEVLVGDDRFVMGNVATSSVINSGANGICETAATGTDVQTLTVGRLRPFSVVASDDELVLATEVVTVSTGVTDVAGNAIAGKTRYNADGTVR